MAPPPGPTRPQRSAPVDRAARRWGLVRPAGLIGLLIFFFPATELPETYPDLPEEAVHETEAGFIYTLSKFVDWPARAFQSRTAPMVFGVIGDDRFATAMERTVEGKLIGGRNLTVKRFDEPVNLDSCQVLFIGPAAADTLEQILRSLRGKSVMTVGEEARFIELGGIVRLRMNEGMVQSEINESMAARAGVKISSKVLGMIGMVKVRNKG